MTRIKDRNWIETDNFMDSSNITKHLHTEGKKEQNTPMSKHHNQQ